MDIEFYFSWLATKLQALINYLYLVEHVRISIWIAGAALCSFILLYLLRNKKVASYLTPPNSFLNLIGKYSFDYSSGEFIKKILAPQKKYQKFLADNIFFESIVQRYQEKQPMGLKEEEKLSEIRKKLQFNTLNKQLHFFRSQQIHNGSILSISVINTDYDIDFDAKVLENYESYFLISYPQIKNEDYMLIANQELQISLMVVKQLYSFKTRPVLTSKINKVGLQLFHSSKLKKQKG